MNGKHARSRKLGQLVMVAIVLSGLVLWAFLSAGQARAQESGGDPTPVSEVAGGLSCPTTDKDGKTTGCPATNGNYDCFRATCIDHTA
jgi:hypothetical protein